MKDIPGETGLDPIRARAPEAAAHWFREAVAAIDAAFGEGYARENPALVAGLVQAAAIDAATSAGRETSEAINHTIVTMGRETNATLLKLKPRLFG